MQPEVGKYYRTLDASIVYILSYELPCPFTGHQTKYPYRGCKLFVDPTGEQQSLRYIWNETGAPAEHYSHGGLRLVEEITPPENPKNWYGRLKKTKRGKL